MTPEQLKERRVEYDRRYREKHLEEIRARARNWYWDHRDQILEYGREWYEENKEKVLVKGQKWRKANPDKVKAISATSRKKNGSKINAATRKWRQDNPEKAKACCQAWRDANPERMRLIKQAAEERRRAKLKNCLADGDDVTVDEWNAQLEAFDHKCAYCQAAAQSLDHVEPLIKGGRHVIDNCVPCCKRCNSSKGQKSLLVWLLTSKIAQQAITEESLCPIH